MGFFALGASFIGQGFLNLKINLIAALQFTAILLVGQGILYITDYMIGSEYNRSNFNQLFDLPYARLVILSLTIVFGSLFAAPVIILVLIKTIFEVWNYVVEKGRLSIN